VGAAFEAGCVAVVIEQEEIARVLRERGYPFALVTSVQRGLGVLAAAHRVAVGARVIAITGSSGKTSTKEYVRAVVRTRYRVHANAGNLNSTVGAPLAVLDADGDAQYLICEVGANQPGEIGAIAEVLQPDVGVITNIGDAHVGHFGSRAGIAQAKSELIAGIRPEGYAVLPRDDDYFLSLGESTRARVVTFGSTAGADACVTSIQQEVSGTAFFVNGQAARVPALGSYHVLNAAAAVAVGQVCGVDEGLAIESLAGVTPLDGRGRIHHVRGTTIIDESYNASPASMLRSIFMLAQVAATRRIAVLGDMLELGTHADDRVREVGNALAASVVDLVFWIGPQGATIEKLLSSSRCQLERFDELADLTGRVLDAVAPDDVVLVKASRACGLDKTVRALVDSPKEKGA